MPRGSLTTPLAAAPGGVTERFTAGQRPPGKWLSSSNFVVRSGFGRPRPGYRRVGSAAVAAADRTLGFSFIGATPSDTNLIIHTASAAYGWDGTAFTAITGTWTAGDPNDHVRFTTFTQSGTLRLIRINRDNAPDYTTGVTTAFADLPGSPPAGIDITTTNGRVVVFRAGGNGRRVQWSDFNDSETWGASSFVDLLDTPDAVVAGRAFGPLSMGVYKEDSVWLGVAQAASVPFRFQLIAETPGPVSPAALVTWRGAQYWLARDGVIYSFDGARVEPVGIDLSETIRTNFDWENRDRIHGAVLGIAEPEVWFWLPRTASSGTLDRAIRLNLATGAMDFHAFPLNTTASLAWTAHPELTWDDLTGTWDTLGDTYASWDAMQLGSFMTAVIGTSVGDVFRFNSGVDDAGTAISWEVVHDWRAPADPDEIFLDGVASYWRRTASALTTTIGVIVSRALGDADTESTSTFDMSTNSNHLVNFVSLRGKWVRVRLAASSAVADMEHRLTEILTWPRRRP